MRSEEARPPIGVLLVNLGTPDSTEVKDVRRYLGEFLMDPRVISLPSLFRWMLVKLIILPRRPKASAKAYAKIWMPGGSPLAVHGQALTEAVQSTLGEPYRVRLAMRYGQPSLQSEIRALTEAGVDRIVVCPLFPQYASATTGSLLERVFEVAKATERVPALSVLPPFFDRAAYLDRVAEVSRPAMEALKPDVVLFSFHGLPESQVEAAHPGCLTENVCKQGQIGEANRYCYRAQCYATAHALAARLGVASPEVSFQSRLGRTPWIRPYTDETVVRLAKAGKKRLLVLCPAFTADCLETLEEIGMRARDSFLESGGEAFAMAPALNSDPGWARVLSRWIQEIGVG